MILPCSAGHFVWETLLPSRKKLSPQKTCWGSSSYICILPGPGFHEHHYTNPQVSVTVRIRFAIILICHEVTGTLRSQERATEWQKNVFYTKSNDFKRLLKWGFLISCKWDAKQQIQAIVWTEFSDRSFPARSFIFSLQCVSVWRKNRRKTKLWFSNDPVIYKLLLPVYRDTM